MLTSQREGGGRFVSSANQTQSARYIDHFLSRLRELGQRTVGQLKGRVEPNWLRTLTHVVHPSIGRHRVVFFLLIFILQFTFIPTPEEAGYSQSDRSDVNERLPAALFFGRRAFVLRLLPPLSSLGSAV